MSAYTPWTRSQHRDVIRREVMDTGSRWFSDAELNQYLDNWLQDLQQDFEFTWACSTLTVGTVTSTTSAPPLLILDTSTISDGAGRGMLRHEAVYYNGFRLAGRLLQDLEVGDPLWRGDTGMGTSAAYGTAPFDTPRLTVMYPDSEHILVWPTPPPPQGTSSNVFVFEYPALLTFATDSSTSGLPVWCQWSAKPYVCSRLFMRPGPLNDAKRSQRYRAQYERSKLRVRRMWDNFLPERYRRLKPGSHYEWEILTPPPAWDVSIGETALGTTTHQIWQQADEAWQDAGETWKDI